MSDNDDMTPEAAAWLRDFFDPEAIAADQPFIFNNKGEYFLPETDFDQLQAILSDAEVNGNQVKLNVGNVVDFDMQRFFRNFFDPDNEALSRPIAFEDGYAVLDQDQYDALQRATAKAETIGQVVTFPIAGKPIDPGP